MPQIATTIADVNVRSHTFNFINKDNQRFWVKFHVKTMQGTTNLTNAEAAALVGEDRETHPREFQAVERDDYPNGRFCVQIIPGADADKGRQSV